MSQADTAQTVRSKIIGVLFKDARQVRGLDLAACAAAAGCSAEALASIESGQTSPSLPALEMLAYVLDVPLTYFWGDRVLSEQHPPERAALPVAEVAAIRQRIVGALLRQARLNARLEAADHGVERDGLHAHPIERPVDVIPQHIDLAVVAHQLANQTMGVLYETLTSSFVRRARGAVGVAPVHQGIIQADFEAFGAAGRDELGDQIPTGATLHRVMRADL